MGNKEWKTIRGTDYSISDQGDVMNTLSGRLLKPQYSSKGYLQVKLHRKKYKIHRLVATYFVEGDTSLTVNHKDMNKTNNHKDNLEWVSEADNRAHALASGNNPRYSEIQALLPEIQRRLKNKEPRRDIAMSLGVSTAILRKYFGRDVKPDMSEDLRRRVQELHTRGMTRNKIAMTLGISDLSVFKVLGKCIRYKMSEEDFLEAQRLRSQRVPYVEIAKTLGCSAALLSKRFGAPLPSIKVPKPREPSIRERQRMAYAAAASRISSGEPVQTVISDLSISKYSYTKFVRPKLPKGIDTRYRQKGKYKLVRDLDTEAITNDFLSGLSTSDVASKHQSSYYVASKLCPQECKQIVVIPDHVISMAKDLFLTAGSLREVVQHSGISETALRRRCRDEYAEAKKRWKSRN